MTHALGLGLAEVAVAVVGQQHGVAQPPLGELRVGQGRVGVNLVPMSRIGLMVVAFHGPV